MIAYLSHDKRLISVLNEDGDVFKLITAQWKNITPADVTPEQRAQAKQVRTRETQAEQVRMRKTQAKQVRMKGTPAKQVRTRAPQAKQIRTGGTQA
ncbi:hypothetical protein DPMN_046214 [Dreissena polymorpha]|uniref:DNA-directed DNA polymerase family A palm domain-containing protein n=1 Tax=Dreissena polymorpha TaxID=45954 RepID=A0A9D4D6F4_DREPO|nr:hypothetical protein DPMN_046214 [Dreissena polymorpha]